MEKRRLNPPNLVPVCFLFYVNIQCIENINAGKFSKKIFFFFDMNFICMGMCLCSCFLQECLQLFSSLLILVCLDNHFDLLWLAQSSDPYFLDYLDKCASVIVFKVGSVASGPSWLPTRIQINWCGSLNEHSGIPVKARMTIFRLKLMTQERLQEYT